MPILAFFTLEATFDTFGLLHGWLLQTDILRLNLFILEYELLGIIILYFNYL